MHVQVLRPSSCYLLATPCAHVPGGPRAHLQRPWQPARCLLHACCLPRLRPHLPALCSRPWLPAPPLPLALARQHYCQGWRRHHPPLALPALIEVAAPAAPAVVGLAAVRVASCPTARVGRAGGRRQCGVLRMPRARPQAPEGMHVRPARSSSTAVGWQGMRDVHKHQAEAASVPRQGWQVKHGAQWPTRAKARTHLRDALRVWVRVLGHQLVQLQQQLRVHVELPVHLPHLRHAHAPLGGACRRAGRRASGPDAWSDWAAPCGRA